MNVVYTTAGGKEIAIYNDPVTAHIKIKFTTGGELPRELTGIFTTPARAKQAVEGYLLKETLKAADKKSKAKDE